MQSFSKTINRDTLHSSLVDLAATIQLDTTTTNALSILSDALSRLCQKKDYIKGSSLDARRISPENIGTRWVIQVVKPEMDGSFTEGTRWNNNQMVFIHTPEDTIPGSVVDQMTNIPEHLLDVYLEGNPLRQLIPEMVNARERLQDYGTCKIIAFHRKLCVSRGYRFADKTHSEWTMEPVERAVIAEATEISALRHNQLKRAQHFAFLEGMRCISICFESKDHKTFGAITIWRKG